MAPDAPEEIDPADELQAYLEALKLELPQPAIPPPEEITRDQELVAQVRADYVANKPGPESFPSMALQVITLLGRPDVDIPRLAQLISRDPGLTASMLRVVNSAIYRGVSRVVSVRDAVARLGLTESGRIAGAAAAKSLFDARARSSLQAYAADFEALYVNAVTCAVTASWLAMQRPPVRADYCYLGGLLHDIGRSVSLRSAANLRAKGNKELVPRSPRTWRIIDNLHVSIGVDVLKVWQLPEFVVDIAAKHHISALAPGDGDLELHIVTLVSSLQLLRSAPALNPGAADDLLIAAKALKLKPQELRAIDTERARFETLARNLASN